MSEGAWPTPGTSTDSTLRITVFILSTVRAARMSLSAPRITSTGASIRANGTHKSIGRAAVRMGLRT